MTWTRWLLLIVVFFFVMIQSRLWMGSGGVRDILRIKKAVALQEQQNIQLEQRNRVLRAEVQDLKTGTGALEEHARLDLGMIRSNETFYMIPDTPTHSTEAEASAGAVASSPVQVLP